MSSNTSGTLKICCYTGEQFYHQIQGSADILRRSPSIKTHYRGSLKLLTFLPFYHIFGLVAVYVWFAFFSRTLVALKDFAPDTILNTVRRHEVTHIFAVPLFWESIHKSAMRAIKSRGEQTVKRCEKGLAFSLKLGGVPALQRAFARKAFAEVRENLFGDSVQFCINGGGYVAPEVLRFMNGIGYKLVNGYGMTEIGITSVELSENVQKIVLGSVGAPVSSVEYRINEQGELLVRGKSIAHSVHTRDGVTCNDGVWFNTHDLFREEKGRFYIQGRKDDLIICDNGENVNPDLLEPKLYADGVERVCILPAQNRPGKLTVLAQVNAYATPERMREVFEQLKQAVRALGLESVTEHVYLTETPLIAGDDFKVNRKKIARLLASGTLPVLGESEATSPDAHALEQRDRELVQRVCAIFAQVLDRAENEISPNAHFFADLGGSSLDYFAVATAVQNEFGVSFPATAQGSIPTAIELAQFIKEQLNA